MKKKTGLHLKPTRITVDLDGDTHLRMRILCAAQNQSMSAFAAHVLEQRIAASDVGDLVRQALQGPTKGKKGESKDLPGQLLLDINEKKRRKPKKGRKE